jgi:hypothetical protein
MCVFTHCEMREDSDRLTGGGEFVVTGQRDENLITDAVHVDCGLRRQGSHQFTIEKSYHFKSLNR